MKSTQKIILCTLILIWASSTRIYASNDDHSRGSSFELGIGGGYGSLGYPTATLNDWTSSVGGRPSGYAHLAYNCFFSEYIGLSLGVDFSRYGSTTQFAGQQTWKDVTDTDDFLNLGYGELYDHTLIVNHWKEMQSVSYVEVPLSIKISVPAGSIYLIGEAGAKAGFPILKNYAGSGSVTHIGYYQPWDLTLEDIDGHGFYTEDGYQPKGNLNEKTIKWSAFAKLGIAIPLATHLDLTIQAFGQYSFSGFKVGGKDMPGFRDDRPDMQKAHYFMDTYSTVLTSALVTGSAKPWHIGAELGIRYTIPHPKSQKGCNCRIIDLPK